MNGDERTSLDAAAVVMRSVIDEFRQEEDGYPTLAELLEIIGLSVPATESLGEVITPINFHATVGGRPYRSSRQSRVGGLNDAAFIEAAALLTMMGEDLARAGSGASTDDICEYLLVVIKQAGITFDDVRPADIGRLGVVGPTRGVRATIGDVIAIPSRQGDFHFASVLVKNRVGTGLGVWRERRRVPALDKSVIPSASRVVFTDEVAIRSGAWPVVGHDEAARSLFPDDPETYYYPSTVHYPGVPRIGEFGSAERSDGTLRDVSRDEAQRVGLLDGTYERGYLSDYLPDVLDDEKGA